MVNRVLVANIRAYCKVTKFSLVVKIITDKTLYQGISNFKLLLKYIWTNKCE